MADKMRYRWGPRVELFIKKTGTVAIEQGDILRLSSSNRRVYAVTGSNNCTAVIGIADSASPATDPTCTIVKVLATGFGTVFEFDLASGSTTTAFKFGQAFILTAVYPQQLTKYGTAGTNPWSSASNVVARCAQEMAASGSTVKVTFLPNKLNREVITGISYTATVHP